MNIRFAETLSRLIARRRISQRSIAEHTGISEASLSNDLRGKEPTLSRLVKLAEFFQVSVDYLIFGKDRQPEITDSSLVCGQLAQSILRMERGIEAQSRIATRIGTILQEDLGRATREASEELERLSSNVVLEEEVWQFERCALQAKVISPMLIDELSIDPETGSIQTGGDFHYVAQILLKNRRIRYHWVYHPDLVPEEAIRHLQHETQETCGGGAVARTEFTPKRNNAMMPLALYQLDLKALRERSPILYEYASAYIHDDWIGILFTPTVPTKVNLLMDKLYFRQVKAFFDEIEEAG